MQAFFLIQSKLLKYYGFSDNKAGRMALRKIISKKGISGNTWDTWKRREEITADGIQTLARIHPSLAKELIGIENAEDQQGKFFLGEVEVKALAQMAEEVLGSGHEQFTRALSENIKAYHYALFIEKPGAREEYSRQQESKKDRGG